MKFYFVFLTLLSLGASFMPNINYLKKNHLYALKNHNEKPIHEMDIFDKFEKYSSENNKEKQAEYLYKIKKFLDRKYNIKSWEQNI